MSERTPLLRDHDQSAIVLDEADSTSIPSPSETYDVYERFTPSQKWFITVVVSMAGLIGPFASGSFIPTISEIAKDLNTTGTVVNYVVGIYIFVIAVGNLIWAPYAGFYGRQPVYLCSLPLITIGSLIAAAANNVLWLIIGRSIQGFGASCVLSVGAATISDIYKLEERGTAMGVFFGFILLGPPLAPITGGFLATYASWRIMQVLLGLLGFIVFIVVLCCLPETSHLGERGVDKIILQSKIRNGIKYDSCGSEIGTRWPWVWLSPFTPLYLMKGPVILLVVMSVSCMLVSYYILIIPMPYTLGPAYGLNTPAAIGACFLPSGLGNIIGATVAGRLADIAVIRGRKCRQGRWYPEDRLLATVPGGLVLVPLALTVFAYTATYIPGKTGLTICLICLFLNGMGVDMVLAPASTYLVDIMHTKGAEVMAVSSATRNGFSAIASALVLPTMNAIGLVNTNLIAAALAWASFLGLFLAIKYGDRLRAIVDVGYTTVKDA